MCRVACLSVCALLLLFIGCGAGRDGDAENSPPPDSSSVNQENTSTPAVLSVEAQLIDKEGFFGAIEYAGVVRGIHEVAVVSETSGVIADVRARLGESVLRGQVLVMLDDSLERYAVEQAKDQLSIAEIEFAAVMQLYDNGNSSPVELARAKANVSGNRSALAQARRQLDNRIIRSPIAGNIAILPQSISVGNYIQPGAMIVRIININQARIDIGLGEREVQMVQAGDSAQVYVAACGTEPQDASIRAIAAGSGEQQSGNFIANIEFPNRCGAVLRSGMTARITIAPNGIENIVIPARALIKEREQYFVFVAQPNGASYLAQRRSIDVAQILGDRAEVMSGIVEKEILIVAPLQILEDGAAVNPATIGG